MFLAFDQMAAQQKRLFYLASCQHGQSLLKFLRLEPSDTGAACHKIQKERRVVAHKRGFKNLASCSREGVNLPGRPDSDLWEHPPRVAYFPDSRMADLKFF